MNPEKSPLLHNTVVKDREGGIYEEFARRNLLANTIRDLSEQFEDKEDVLHKPSEPTLYAKLYALSQIQQSRLGVAGFSPLSPIEQGLIGSLWTVSAKVAPPHDQYQLGETTISTRAISFSSDATMESEVDILGLNIFIEDFNVDEVGIEGFNEDIQPSKGLLIVGDAGKKGPVLLDGAPKTVNGETVIFAVRSKISNDAKLYTMDFVSSKDRDIASFQHPSGIRYENDNVAYVMLPDSQVMRVEQLTGQAQIEAVAELDKATEAFKDKKRKDDLSGEERIAANNAMRGITEGPNSI